jgi:nucleotide-binding universal stress UspA family protein
LLRKKQIVKHGGKKMEKVLIAADDTRGSLSVLEVFRNQVRPPQEVILVHVQRPLGKSLMGNMLGEAEMSTLKEMVKETEFQEELDKKSEKVLSYFQNELKNNGLFTIRTIIRAGNVHEEILKVAEEEKVDMIILGCNGKTGLDRLLSGCVTRDVERRASVPVIVAKAGGCSAKEKTCVEPLGELQEVYNAR